MVSECLLASPAQGDFSVTIHVHALNALTCLALGTTRAQEYVPWVSTVQRAHALVPNFLVLLDDTAFSLDSKTTVHVLNVQLGNTVPIQVHQSCLSFGALRDIIASEAPVFHLQRMVSPVCGAQRVATAHLEAQLQSNVRLVRTIQRSEQRTLLPVYDASLEKHAPVLVCLLQMRIVQRGTIAQVAKALRQTCCIPARLVTTVLKERRSHCPVPAVSGRRFLAGAPVIYVPPVSIVIRTNYVRDRTHRSPNYV